MLVFFDSIRRKISGEKYPTARWAIDASRKMEANTLIRWLHEVTSALRERPP
jgi:hypothetical protein